MADTKTITLANKALEVTVAVDKNGLPVLRGLAVPGKTRASRTHSKYWEDSATPLVEVRYSHEGIVEAKSSKALVGNRASARLQYVSHEEVSDKTGVSKTLHVTMRDPETDVVVVSHLTLFNDLPALRGTTTVKNGGKSDIVVAHVTSLLLSAVTGDELWWKNYTVSDARSSWFREAQWAEHTLPSLGVDDAGINGYPERYPATHANYSISNNGSFSTNGHLPMGMLQRTDKTETWLWQIECNGCWRWDLGDFKDDLYVGMSGPTGLDHEFFEKLASGQEFTTVPATVVYTAGGTEAAFDALTTYRRTIRRPHADNVKLGVIFNDYMNCLMGDPTDGKVLALVEPAKRAGAEYFCIDCGWYADDSNWWDDVGEWEPSKKRFPSGFDTMLQKIRDQGLIPGCWLEPEVVGIRSVVGKRLPEECFFQRDGRRMIEKGRFQLDYRHPETIKWMDSVVDKLVLQYGVGYFKFDYNIEIVNSTDRDAASPGAAQLAHQRAYLAWVNGLYDRHPDLVIESCSSGGSRMDYALLATHSLQSTSDQQCPVLYAAIAASVPTAVTPEQAANWAYPQADWDDEKNAMTVVNSMLGRVHLSGHLGRLSAAQMELVQAGLTIYKDVIRKDIPSAQAFWPLGFPAWHDEWVALGLRTADSKTAYVAVYRRGGEKEQCSLPISVFGKGSDVKVELLYPKFKAVAAWNKDQGSLDVTLPVAICARLYRLSM
ncbi:hypothetical protein KEM52_006119 [Ascosphaera acerosa]|nr:hypothetical protein KEM52_006119 [Ascosphaera acerosa]